MKVRGFVPVALAYPAAAGVGAAVVAIEFAALALILGGDTGLAGLADGWWILPVAWAYAFVVFMAGLLVIGTPLWLLMAGLGRRSRLDATLAGSILTAMAGFLILQSLNGGTWSWGPPIYAAVLAIPGAAAGWTLHRVAYGRASA